MKKTLKQVLVALMIAVLALCSCACGGSENSTSQTSKKEYSEVERGEGVDYKAKIKTDGTAKVLWNIQKGVYKAEEHTPADMGSATWFAYQLTMLTYNGKILTYAFEQSIIDDVLALDMMCFYTDIQGGTMAVAPVTECGYTIACEAAAITAVEGQTITVGETTYEITAGTTNCVNAKAGTGTVDTFKVGDKVTVLLGKGDAVYYIFLVG